MKTSILNEALKYFNKNYSIIPLREDKTPAISSFSTEINNFKDEEEVKNAFNKPSVKGIGVITGKISGIFVLDVDKPSIFEELIKERNYTIPVTVSVKTPKKNGYHYWFKYPNDRTLKTTKKLYETIVDIKATGGYVCVPCSYYREKIIIDDKEIIKEGYYEWINPLDQYEIAEAPDWIFNELDKIRDSSSGGELTRIVKGVNEGERDTSATSICGKILYSLKNINEWNTIGWDLFRAWNTTCNPPLDEKQLNKVFQSIAGIELRRRQNEPINELEEPISYNDFIRKEIPPDRWVIDNLLPYGGITILAAPPSHYKSWFMLYLAILIAKGNDFFEFAVKQMPVLIMNEEDSEFFFQDRIKMITDEKDLPIYFYHNKNIKINEEIVEKLLIICQKNGIKMIMMDAMIRFHNFEENSAGDMSKFFDFFKPLLNSDISVLFIHHCRKEGLFNNKKNHIEKMRGSSDIGAMVHSHLALELSDDYLLLFQGKVKGAKRIDGLKMKISFENSKFSITKEGNIEIDKLLNSQAREAIMEIIKDNPGITGKEMRFKLKSVFAERTIKGILPMMEGIDIYSQGGYRKNYFLRQDIDINPDSLL